MSFPSLLKAWHSHFESNAGLKAAIPGGMWTGEVPEGTTYPYIWVNLGSVNTHFNMVDRGEYARIFTHIYALGAMEAEEAASLFQLNYDEAVLQFPGGSGYRCIAVIPQQYRIISENLRHKSGSLVFRAMLMYFVLYQRPR